MIIFDYFIVQIYYIKLFSIMTISITYAVSRHHVQKINFSLTRWIKNKYGKSGKFFKKISISRLSRTFLYHNHSIRGFNLKILAKSLNRKRTSWIDYHIYIRLCFLLSTFSQIFSFCLFIFLIGFFNRFVFLFIFFAHLFPHYCIFIFLFILWFIFLISQNYPC